MNVVKGEAMNYISIENQARMTMWYRLIYLGIAMRVTLGGTQLFLLDVISPLEQFKEKKKSVTIKFWFYDVHVEKQDIDFLMK